MYCLFVCWTLSSHLADSSTLDILKCFLMIFFLNDAYIKELELLSSSFFPLSLSVCLGGVHLREIRDLSPFFSICAEAHELGFPLLKVRDPP